MELPSLAAGLVGPSVEVFLGDERNYRPALWRHVRCANFLRANEEFLLEAEFHSFMAAECLLKLMFCLARYASGVSVNMRKEFGVAKAARTMGTT